MTERRMTTTKWLMLFAMMWSQLVFAGHQFDHNVSDSSGSCSVCVQLDRDDHLTADHHKPELSSHSEAFPVAQLVPILAPSFASYCARLTLISTTYS